LERRKLGSVAALSDLPIFFQTRYGGAAMANAVIKAKKLNPSAHGGGVRGDNSALRSSIFEGRFGRMFRSLPPAEWPRDALVTLGHEMTSDPETDPDDKTLPAAAPEDNAKRIQDDEENSGIPAGYTYLGQFIDHDITFDPASSLQQQNDPDALVDYRTPRLDLDSVYGRGPADQPYMYDGKKLRLGRPLFELEKPTKVRDLPRYIDVATPDAAKRALIGDKRNDENVIVSQLHGAMLQFHNKLADQDPNASFEDVQQAVRWHYQWIVVNDFLVKICGEDIVSAILPHRGKNAPIWENEPKFAFYKWREDPFMPVEFAVAAYRFGHSMVRPIYRLNTELKGGDNPLEANPREINRGLAGRFFVFAGVQNRGLNGFDEFPKQWAIDWSLFFDIKNSAAKTGQKRVQPAYKIDTALVNPLGFLPEFSELPRPANGTMTVTDLQSVAVDKLLNPANLAERNLLRGMAMGLPSGQDVALAMGLTPIAEDNLRVGKAVMGDWDGNTKLKDIHPSFEGKAPLWYYVLAEAQFEWFQRASGKNGKGDEEPVRLGTVGGRIVAETLIGLLWADGHSYLRQAPNWQPDTIRTMGDLIGFALE
jgi:Animal haem peroxidase